MLWLVTLSCRSADVERLLSESVDGLSADADDPDQLRLTLQDSESTLESEEASREIRTQIDAFVERLNGVARLRWGRVFEGVSVASVKSVDEDGRETTHISVGPAVDHMLPEDFADMVERLGYERPQLPRGFESVRALDFGSAMLIAESNPQATRALHLVDLMLKGDDEIDWTAGYAALEIVEHDLQNRGVNGRELDWWTKRERENFRATANSPEVLGYAARHGKPSRLKEARMTTGVAIWFIKGVVADWLSYLGEQDQTEPGAGGEISGPSNSCTG